MKASLKFRENDKPFFRAKVPLNILGLPFQSSLSAGDSKELCLGIGTFFDSGPALRFAYRPNDSSNPFSLILKTGIGHLGSPIDAPMTMSAEFNLVGTATNPSRPTFFLHFRPQFGDFSIKKSQGASVDQPIEFYKTKDASTAAAEGFSQIDGDSSLEVVEKSNYFNHDHNQRHSNGVLSVDQLTNLTSKSSSLLSSAVGTGVDTALTGMELGARTVLPLTKGAVLKFRWGINFPQDFRSLFSKEQKTEEGEKTIANPVAPVAPSRIPLLLMNKISIEHVPKVESRHPSSQNQQVGPGPNCSSGFDLAQSCFNLKHQMEGLHVENGRLRQALDDLRSEFTHSGRQLSGKNWSDRRSSNLGGGSFGLKEMKDGDSSADVKKPPFVLSSS